MGIRFLKIQGKDDYIERLERKLLPRGCPVDGQIDLTYRCNLKCRHCFIVQEEDKEELKFEEVVSIINEIYGTGCLWLCFSGGEVFLREDFLDIYAYARRKGFLVSIFTNGTLIDERTADYLAENPPYSVEITLNGITEGVYEAVTNVLGSFREAMRAIRLLKERKLPLVLKCNGMSINRDEILRIKGSSEELLGKGRFRCDLVLYPGLDGSKNPCGLRLTVDEILKIQSSDKDMLSLCEDQVLRGKENSRLKDGYLFQCGLSSFQIDPYGRMRLCPFIKEPSADLRKEEFLKGFNRLCVYFQGLRRKAETKCRECKIKYLCRQCPGRALAENGDMESPVDFYCALARKQEGIMEEVAKTTITKGGAIC